MRDVMKWNKLGLIEVPKDADWLYSHLQNPFPEELGGGLYKVHFSGRDSSNQACGGWVVIDMKDPLRVQEVSKAPTLSHGRLGTFDDCGVMPACLVEQDGLQNLFYTGWSKSVKTPFTLFIGLAQSKDKGKTFSRVSEAPILGRNKIDPLMTASPWVLFENDIWRMWYVSCVEWEQLEDEVKHYYHIRYAESDNGVDWHTDGRVCIDFDSDEYALARPVVARDKDGYTMWFCHRGGDRSYQLGFAYSEDGISWVRNDDIAGLSTSKGNWDSDMICYACPLDWDNDRYLLYNGNEYGKAGFGIAKLACSAASA